MGKMINSYLKQDAELDDRVVHLLFSANRWEKKCVRVLLTACRVLQELHICAGN